MRLRVIAAIAKREWLEHATNVRLVSILALTVALTPLSVFIGIRDYQTRLSDHQTLEGFRQDLIQGSAGRRIAGIPFLRTEVPRMEVLRVIRPPRPLSVLVQGLDSSLPSYWDFSRIGIEEGPRAGGEASLAGTFARFDLEFLVRVVFGLLAVLIGFDAVGSERESGTLRAALSNPVSRLSFLTGKFAGGALFLAGGLGMILLAAAAGAAWQIPAFWTGERLNALVWMGGVWFVYLLFIYSSALLISILQTSRKTALLLATLTWFVLAFAIAPLGALVGRISFPAPPKLEVKTQKERVCRELENEAAAKMGKIYVEISGTEPSAGFSADFSAHSEELLPLFRPVVLNMIERRNEAFEQISSLRRRALRGERRVVRMAVGLSPAALAAEIAANLAGTGDGAHQDWLDAIEDHRKALNEVLFDDPPQAKVSLLKATMWPILRRPPSFEDIPSFNPPKQGPLVTMRRNLWAVALLGLYSLAVLAAVFVAFARSDIR